MKHLVSWFAGIDLGDKMHQVHLTDADGKACGSATFPHGGKGVPSCSVGEACRWRPGSDRGCPPHGAVVEGLLEGLCGLRHQPEAGQSGSGSVCVVRGEG